MPFSQKPEEISFSDILDTDEIASAASRMVRSFVRILTLLIVATLSFVVGVYVGTHEGREGAARFNHGKDHVFAQRTAPEDRRGHNRP